MTTAYAEAEARVARLAADQPQAASTAFRGPSQHQMAPAPKRAPSLTEQNQTEAEREEASSKRARTAGEYGSASTVGGDGQAPRKAEMLEEILDRFDADGDGVLSESELQSWWAFVQQPTNNSAGLCSLKSLMQQAGHRVGTPLDVRGLESLYACDGSLELGSTFRNILEDVPAPMTANLKFYRNRIPFPGGMTIEEFHTGSRASDYEWLEQAHNYIQWLFPCSQASMFNAEAQALTEKEADVMAADATIQARLKVSLRLILAFFGFVVADGDGGGAGPTIQRAADAQERLANLSSHSHNFLRISRILQCLGETGLSAWQRPFLEALIQEVNVGTLATAEMSLRQHWLEHVSDMEEREALRGLLPSQQQRSNLELEEGNGLPLPGPGTHLTVDSAIAELANEGAVSEQDRDAFHKAVYEALCNGGSIVEEDQPSPLRRLGLKVKRAFTAVMESSPIDEAEAEETEEHSTTNVNANEEKDDSAAADGADDTEGDDSVECSQEGILNGIMIYLCPESYSGSELQALRTQLRQHGAGCLEDIDLETATHCICECTSTEAFLALQRDTETDAIAVNAEWLHACIRAGTALPVTEADVHWLPQAGDAGEGNDEHEEEEPQEVQLPASYIDHWDRTHVRLPCSPRNLVGNKHSQRSSCWALIVHTLSRPLHDLPTLECAMRRLQCGRRLDLTVLRQAVETMPAAEEFSRQFFGETLPGLVKLVLACPAAGILPAEGGIPLLRKGVPAAITLSRRAVSCLLACAFFCIFPQRSKSHRLGLPSINFVSLFADSGGSSWGGHGELY